MVVGRSRRVCWTVHDAPQRAAQETSIALGAPLQLAHRDPTPVPVARAQAYGHGDDGAPSSPSSSLLAVKEADAPGSNGGSGEGGGLPLVTRNRGLSRASREIAGAPHVGTHHVRHPGPVVPRQRRGEHHEVSVAGHHAQERNTRLALVRRDRRKPRPLDVNDCRLVSRDRFCRTPPECLCQSRVARRIGFSLARRVPLLLFLPPADDRFFRPARRRLRVHPVDLRQADLPLSRLLAGLRARRDSGLFFNSRTVIKVVRVRFCACMRPMHGLHGEDVVHRDRHELRLFRRREELVAGRREARPLMNPESSPSVPHRHCAKCAPSASRPH